MSNPFDFLEPIARLTRDELSQYANTDNAKLANQALKLLSELSNVSAAASLKRIADYLEEITRQNRFEKRED